MVERIGQMPKFTSEAQLIALGMPKDPKEQERQITKMAKLAIRKTQHGTACFIPEKTDREN